MTFPAPLQKVFFFLKQRRKPALSHSQTRPRRTWDAWFSITAGPAGAFLNSLLPTRHRYSAKGAGGVVRRCVLLAGSSCSSQRRSDIIFNNTLSLSSLTYRENAPLFEQWWTDVVGLDGLSCSIKSWCWTPRAPATSDSPYGLHVG